MQPLHASISQPPIHTAVGKRPQGASPQPRPLLSLSAQVGRTGLCEVARLGLRPQEAWRARRR